MASNFQQKRTRIIPTVRADKSTDSLRLTFCDTIEILSIKKFIMLRIIKKIFFYIFCTLTFLSLLSALSVIFSDKVDNSTIWLVIGATLFLILITVLYRNLIKCDFVHNRSEISNWSTDKVLYKAGFKILIVSLFVSFFANTIAFFVQYSSEERSIGAVIYILLGIISILTFPVYKERRVINNKTWTFPENYKYLFILLSLFGYLGVFIIGAVFVMGLLSILAIGGGVL